MLLAWLRKCWERRKLRSGPLRQWTARTCLFAQEEQKVTVLSDKLASFGVDVEALLSGLVEQGEEEETGGDDLR